MKKHSLTDIEVKNWHLITNKNLGETSKFLSFMQQEKIIIGVDEVGRGCLAGPVVSSAVLFSNIDFLVDLKDSKLLSEQRREELFTPITTQNKYGVGVATLEEIETLNILNASLLSMKRSVEDLIAKEKINKKTIKIVLLDGNQIIKNAPEDWIQIPIIKGDLKVPLISASSIIAKVTRDRMMKEYSLKYPNYGFEIHKGYATELHRNQIRIQGVTDIHRKTFKGVREHLSLK